MESLYLIPILLLAVSTNLDNLGVGISYGIRRHCIPLGYNIMIAAINSVGTIISMSAGERLYSIMQPETAGYIGAAIFMAAGSFLVCKGVYNKLAGRADFTAEEAAMEDRSLVSRTFMIINRPELIGMYCAAHIGFREGLLLSLALTFSNLVTGVGAGLIGLSLWLTTLLIFIFGVAAMSLGMQIGGYTGRRWFGGLSDPAAGALLIMIGIYEIAF